MFFRLSCFHSSYFIKTRYATFLSSSKPFYDVHHLQVTELAQILKDQEKRNLFQLVDVREPNEIEIAKYPSQETILNLPFSEIPSWIGKIERGELLDFNKPVVLMCRSGARSMKVASILDKEGFSKVYNLQGGILAYSNQVDSTIPQY